MSEIENRTFDVDLELHDGDAITSDTVGQVDSADQIIDLGSSTAKVAFDMLLRISALEIASNDEVYRIVLEGSSTSDFSSTIVNLLDVSVGANEVLGPNVDQDSAVGTYVLSGTNALNGTEYRYVRLYVDVTGTISTGITLIASLHKRGD